MLIEEFDRLTGKVRKTKTRFGRFKCDVCDNVYERRLSQTRSSVRDLCSHKCINAGRKHTQEWKDLMSLRNSDSGNPFFGRHHDDKTRSLISEKASEAWERDDYRQSQVERLRKQIGEKNPFFGKRHSEETCLRMSKIRSSKIAAGELRSGPRGRQGLYTSEKTGRVERYDSFFELLRMRMLDSSNVVVSWTKQHGVQIPYVLESKHRLYVPDFCVQLCDGSTRFEEIKGYEEEKKRDSKLSALNAYCDKHGYAMMYIDFEFLEELCKQLFGASIATLRKREFQK